MKVVKLLDQASEDGPRGSLREQVGDHHDAGEVFDGDDTTADEIAKELGGTQDVLGLLEGDGIIFFSPSRARDGGKASYAPALATPTTNRRRTTVRPRRPPRPPAPAA